MNTATRHPLLTGTAVVLLVAATMYGCKDFLSTNGEPEGTLSEQTLQNKAGVEGPELLVVPCLGFGPGGVRLGYGGGFFDRTLDALSPRPATVGVSFTHGFLPFLRALRSDDRLDALITEDGVMWQRP